MERVKENQFENQIGGHQYLAQSETSFDSNDNKYNIYLNECVSQALADPNNSV